MGFFSDAVEDQVEVVEELLEAGEVEAAEAAAEIFADSFGGN